MRPRLSNAKLLFASNVVLIAALVAVAGPQLPSKSNLPFAVRSLTGLDRVEVRVWPWKHMPAGLELSARKIQEAWQDRLKAAGFKLASGTDVPKLDLQVKLESDSNVPDALAVRALVTLKQHVRVNRLDTELLLPTWTGVYTELTPKSEIDVELHTMKDRLIEEFIYRAQLASRVQK